MDVIPDIFIVAHARQFGIPVVTFDRTFLKYEVVVIA